MRQGRTCQPRSLSEYLLVLSHGRWISLGFGLFGLGPTLCAHSPPQSTPTLQERRQIFKRLWVKHISCHSADTFSRPRNRNLRIPRADLIMPNTGSTMCLRRVESFTSRRTQFALHLFWFFRFKVRGLGFLTVLS